MIHPVIFIVGPTGSGKSKLAFMLAKKIKGEIVSCDSMQVYQGMDIGTAKPTKKEQEKIRHHLLDLISPRKEYSVFQYRNFALMALQKIICRRHQPIVVGGSGLYVKAMVDGLSPQPGKQAGFRKSLQHISAAKLHQKLKKIDPLRAHKINVHDRKRIIRALEIYEASNRRMSEWEKETRGLESENLRPLVFGVIRGRAELYKRIEDRIDKMFQKGWISEVKRLKRAGFSKTAQFAIGYKEILEYLAGKIDEGQMIFEIKKRTRHLAKRQLTWFKKDPRISWIQMSKESYSSAAKQIIAQIRSEID